MTKLIFTLATVLLAFASKAQVSENRNKQNFTKIEVESGIEVIYTESEEISIKAEASNSNELSNIITEYNGKTLRIFYSNGKNSKTINFLKVYVNAHNIDSFKANGSAKIVFKNCVYSKDITIELASGANFNGLLAKNNSTTLKGSSGSIFCINVQTDNLRGDFKSGAAISLAGNAKKTIINTTTGAHCNAKNLSSEKLNINAREISSVLINGQGSIFANAEKGSSITYFGTPKKRTLSENSVAVNVEKKNTATPIALN